MPNQQIPDVGVRLSAEGVDEVVRAFQQVSAAAKKSGHDSSLGMKALHDALDGVQELLPAIGVGAALVGFSELVKSSLESADAIGKLSQKTGLSTETLSTLSFAAKTADVDFEGLSGALVKFDKAMGDLDGGTKKAALAVKELFGNTNALKGLDTDQRFAKVAEAIGKLPPGYQKTTDAMNFFGKAGANMIPLLNELAEKGFANVRKEAEALGLVIDAKTAAAATRAKDSFALLKAQVEGVALQFTEGLAPAVADAMETVSESLASGGQTGLEKFGEAVGALVKGVTLAFLAVGTMFGAVGVAISFGLEEMVDEAKTQFRELETAASAAGKAIKLALHGDFAGAKQTIADAAAENDAATAAQKKRMATRNTQAEVAHGAALQSIADSYNALFHAPDSTKVHPTQEERDRAVAAQAELTKATLALEQQRLDNELALAKQYDALNASREKALYDQGLVSLAQYYDDRANAVTAGAARELATLQQERASLAAAPLAVKPDATTDQIAAAEIARRQQVEALDQKIALAQVGREQQLQALQVERANAELALAQKRLQVEDEIKTAQGNTYGAALDAINANAAALARLHLPPDLIAQITQVQQRAAALSELQREGQNATGVLSDLQSHVGAQVAGGDLFPFQAVEQYNAAVQRAIPRLRELATVQLLAAVTPEERHAAEQFATDIDTLAASTDEGAKRMAEFKASLESSLTSDVEQFFTTGIDQAHGFGEAMRSLAGSVVTSLQQIVAQMLATIVVRKALGAIFGSGTDDGLSASASKIAVASIPLGVAGHAVEMGGNAVLEGATALGASAAALFIAASAMKGTSLFGFASGGYTGDGGMYEPAGIVHRGEFVVNASAVRQPGVLSALAAINNGMRTPSLRPLHGPGYADGGLVGAPLSGGSSGNGSEGFDGELRVGLEDGLVLKHMATTNGRRVMLKQMAQNPKAFRAALGL